MTGTLFVVGTPIGNLEDLTFRALRTLREVDAIAAEDTRRTAKLLAHYEVRKPLLSLHEHNEHRETPRIIARLAGGQSIALVTDAGTPGIADPGARLVAAAHAAGVRVVPVPGPSAVATALSVSGFSASEFAFMGFTPRSGREREEWFKRLSLETRPVVFFEAPHRVERTLAELGIMVNRPIFVTRELTKIHEELVIYRTGGVRMSRLSTGELTVVVGPSELEDQALPEGFDTADVFGRLTEGAGFSAEMATSVMQTAFGVGAQEIRKAVKKRRISINRQNDR